MEEEEKIVRNNNRINKWGEIYAQDAFLEGGERPYKDVKCAWLVRWMRELLHVEDVWRTARMKNWPIMEYGVLFVFETIKKETAVLVYGVFW